MNKLIYNLTFIALFTLVVSGSSFAVNIVNYYYEPVRLEVVDCKTYDNYHSFPSNFKWSIWKGGDLSSKAKYLFVDTLKTGYYSVLTGTNIPKQLCINVFDLKHKSDNLKTKISAYNTCTVNVIPNEDNTDISLDSSYDCHSQKL